MHFKHIVTALDVLEHTGKIKFHFLLFRNLIANPDLSSVEYKKPLIFVLTISQNTWKRESWIHKLSFYVLQNLKKKILQNLTEMKLVRFSRKVSFKILQREK